MRAIVGLVLLTVKGMRDSRHKSKVRVLRTVRMANVCIYDVILYIVQSRLDYCNSLLCGTTEWNLIDFSGCKTPWHALSSELRGQPVHLISYTNYWLPIRQRVRFKLAAVTFKAKHSGLPAYLHDDLHDYQPTRMLRSSTAHLLQRSLVLTSVASRAFTVAAPTVWNAIC